MALSDLWKEIIQDPLTLEIQVCYYFIINSIFETNRITECSGNSFSCLLLSASQLCFAWSTAGEFTMMELAETVKEVQLYGFSCFTFLQAQAS